MPARPAVHGCTRLGAATGRRATCRPCPARTARRPRPDEGSPAPDAASPASAERTTGASSPPRPPSSAPGRRRATDLGAGPRSTESGTPGEHGRPRPAQGDRGRAGAFPSVRVTAFERIADPFVRRARLGAQAPRGPTFCPSALRGAAMGVLRAAEQSRGSTTMMRTAVAQDTLSAWPTAPETPVAAAAPQREGSYGGRRRWLCGCWTRTRTGSSSRGATAASSHTTGGRRSRPVRRRRALWERQRARR
jgi:hypothetical protein